MESYADTRRVKQLIYGGEILSEEDYDSMLEKIDDFPRDVQHGCRKPSLYLQLFEDMINTVYEHESHLLSQNEWDVFATLKYYCYNARYCLIRLVLRKPDQWHALSSLGGYKKEVGEVGLIRAITDLCRPWHEVMNGAREELGVDTASGVKNEVQQVASDPFDEVRASTCQNNNAEAGPSSTRSSSTLSESDIPLIDQSFQGDFSEVQLGSFCYDESIMDITELLNRLSVKQLKELVRETKSKPSKSTKPEMMRALMNHAARQSVLQLPPSPMNERLRRASKPCLRQATLDDVKPSIKGKEKAVFRNQEQRLVQMVLKILGKCVKVNGDFYRLARRLHLICFRCTEQPTSLLLPALLASFKKRTYPQYEYKRDKSIWPTREDLLAYEEALELELYLEEVMTKLPEKDRVPRTPVPLGGSVAPTTPIGQILRTPKTPLKTPKDPPVLGSGVKEEEVGDVSAILEVIDVEEGDASVQKAKRVKDLLYEQIYPRWKESIEAKSREESWDRKPGLERFEPGHIYTRMLYHALRSFATLKAYQAEYDILQALLGQSFYRRGSRAKWYERRAIIEMTYLSKADGEKRDQEILQRAMNGVKEALLDEDTGIVWRPGLFRRLQRLEKMLHIPEEERASPEGELKQPQKVFIKAVRVIKRSNSMSLEDNGKGVKRDEVDGLHAYFTPKKNVAEVKMEGPKEEVKDNGQEKTRVPSWKGKSLWIGRDNEEVYVEIRALQYYEDLGFKGFHAETRILTTIFALLFWDIIFADTPGAFETPYQTAPLDLAEDTFYYARQDLIEARLEEIRNGGAEQILEHRDAEHRDKQTLCVGLRWDMCSRSDLVQIVECLGGHTLALICRLFCQDYAGRSSGVPDLVVWCAERGICKFVEVKGPGDRPQENQKLWFDSLLRAKANVEICHVIDVNAPPKEKSKTPGSTRKRKVVVPVHPDLGYDDENDDDRRGYDVYDGEGSIAPDHYTPSTLEASAPKKRRRRKKVVEDELPSFFASDADDGMP